MMRRTVLLLAVVSLALSCRAAPPAPAFDPDGMPDAYRSATGALMEPGTTRAWRITSAGGFDNGAWQVRVAPSSGGIAADPPRRIAAEDRWLPVLHWTRASGPVRWEFSAVCAAQRDTQLVASVEISARNSGEGEAEARLDLVLAHRDASAGYAAWDAGDEPLRWGGGGSGLPVEGWVEGAKAASANDAGTDSTAVIWKLASGERRAMRLVLPTYPTAERELARVADRAQNDVAEAGRRRWRAEIARGAQFDLQDPEVENALHAATVVLLCCRERHAGRWLPIGGPFQYRDVWLRDGARAIAALSVAGYTEAARQLAQGLLAFQWPNGAFLSQRGQLDGTGQALWALEQSMLRPSPDPGFARQADAVVRACRWLHLQQELGAHLHERFPMMLPFAEPRDAEMTRAQLLGNDAWAIAGVRSAARLLSAARRPVDAQAMEDFLRDYRAAFAAALGSSGQPDLPPSWQGPGRDWGAYAAAWPCAALAPENPRCAAFAERVWRAGGGAGLTFYAHPDSLHGYLGADLGVWAMLDGRRAQADSVLEAMLRWRTASGTAGELFTRTGDFGVNYPPHPTSAAALWLVVRNAVIHDDDDTLRLTMGARARWWRGARIAGAPTRWGSLRLDFQRSAERARWSWTPVPVWTALTLPPGTALAAAPATPLVGTAGGTRIWAPPGTRAGEASLSEVANP
jgi:hypothetical protein